MAEFETAEVTWAIHPQYFYIALTSEAETRQRIKSNIQALIDQNNLSKPKAEPEHWIPENSDDEQSHVEDIQENCKIHFGDFVLAPCRYIDYKEGRLFRGQIIDYTCHDLLGDNFKVRPYS